jgi:hypothetical protein
MVSSITTLTIFFKEEKPFFCLCGFRGSLFVVCSNKYSEVQRFTKEINNKENEGKMGFITQIYIDL